METLYKYLDVESAKAMLRFSNIQFTRATKLNDPFDCHQELLDFSTFDRVSKIGYSVKEDFEKLRKCSMICSLSKVHDSILMWSYYNQHTGVCIGLNVEKVRASFKRDHPEASDGLVPFDVKYSSTLNKLDYMPNQSVALRYMASQKALEWRHEEEVRMLALVALCHGEYLSDNYWRPKIDAECFASIYLGVNMDEQNKTEIINLAQSLNPNVKIYYMRVDSEAFKLNGIEIPKEEWLKIII